MHNLYLVRHAHAEWSQDENRPLSDQGFLDAERVANVLIEFPIIKIYSSPYLRAQQTIYPLSIRLNIKVEIEPDLRERCLSSEAIDDFWGAVKRSWADPNFAHPGGESNSAVRKRGVAVVFRNLEQQRSNHIVLSTHGNLLALLLQKFDPSIDYDFWKSMTFPDIYKLSITAQGKAIIVRLWG
jgi:2,3-bisphosphoglycerate-dependent phosphoglycerate mutase